jgi:hypothetical protein
MAWLCFALISFVCSPCSLLFSVRSLAHTADCYNVFVQPGSQVVGEVCTGGRRLAGAAAFGVWKSSFLGVEAWLAHLALFSVVGWLVM